MQGITTLYSATMNGLKLEYLDNGINDLDGIDIMSIIIIIILVDNILSFKNGLMTVPNMII